jgi:hypothetical protein
MKSDNDNKGNRLRARWLYRDKEGYSMPFPQLAITLGYPPFTLGYHSDWTLPHGESGINSG